MEIMDCVDRCLKLIYEKWYYDKPVNLFHRDKKNLTKAILRYGYVCSQMGWAFDSHFVTKQLISTLVKINKEDISYIPVFLEACIDTSVRQRSEELNEQDKLQRLGLTKSSLPKGKFRDQREKSLEQVVGKIKDNLLPDSVVVVRQSDTEIMASMYRELSKKAPKKAPIKQMNLF